MDELIASVNEAHKYKKVDNKKFVGVADHIRHLISPKTSYPGVLSELSLNALDQIIDILSFFRSLVLSNANIFQKKHITRVIDSMNLIALAYTVKFQLSNNRMDLDNAENEIRNAINTCKEFGLFNDLQFSASAIYNIASFLMKLKAYEYSINLFKIVINISDKDELKPKCYKMICQCLIALNDTNNPDFMNLLYKSCDQINIIYTLTMINPPSNPDKITKILSNITKTSKIGDYANEFKRLLPFYALHGDIQKLNEYDDYKNFFPNLKPPRICYFNQQELDQYFHSCYQLFENTMFHKCISQSINLLKRFPQSKITPHMMLALFFLHYWIVFSYDAVGKPDAGIFYAKKMRKLFHQYPFIGGFAVFLELKCKIHAQQFDKIHEIPKIEFNSMYNWESVATFHHAVWEYFSFDTNCINDFDQIYESNSNILVQREAFNYFVRALKEFQCEFSLDEFANICSTSNETKALFLYHKVIENSKNINFDELWKFDSKRCINLDEVKMNIEMLNEAEKHAHGFLSITRKIKQLKALFIGTCDMETTALLISSSLSLYLDKLLPNCPNQYQLKFPILSIAYIHIYDIEPCLLFAYFCPRSKPFVVRIKTGDKVDNFLDKLEQIQKDSMGISTQLSQKEWWKQKIHLDKQLERLIADFEANVLGFWKCLLSPISPINSQSPLVTSLSVYLQTIPQKMVSQVKADIEKAIKFIFPKKFVMQNCKEKGTLQLLLGKFIHQIPWESISFVVKNSISITRIPSMKVAAIQSLKQVPVVVDPHSAFYILNPKGDLTKTEEHFEPLFNKLSWDGFVKNIPNKEEMTSRLQNTDLFIYCGHGSGREFFDYDSLISEKKACKSTMFLMGCSSGKLNDEGEIDPIGVPYSCVAAGSGAVLANLWNVTDGEIDRFLSSLLQKMKKNGKNDQFVLESAVLECRNACKLRYLTGAAPVIYGFPTLVQKLI